MDKPLFTKHIQTISDVKEFFIYLLTDLDCPFHPDEAFSTYKDNGMPMFTDSMASKLDWQMIVCETVCFAAGESIYKIAFEVLNDVQEQIKN